MNRRHLLTCAIVLAMGTAMAQEPRNALPPPPAPPAGAGQAAPLAPPPPPAPLAEARRSQASGTIARFLVNPNGDVDGVLLDDHTQVGMPPGMGTSLASKLHRGDRISVEGFRVGNLPLLQADSIKSGSLQLTDTPPATPPAPPAPPALQPMDAHGRVMQPLYGPRGDVAGVLLDEGSILRMPPPAIARAGALVQPNARLSVKGFGVATPYGRAIQVTAIGPTPGSEQPVATPPQPGPMPPPPPAPPQPGVALGGTPASAPPAPTP